MGLLNKLLNREEGALFNRISDSKAERVEQGFEEKLQVILQNAGNYELKKDILPDTLEQEFGREIYTRGGNRCQPDKFTYGIYKGSERILYIRLWDFYSDYARAANRQIKSFCDANRIKMLDFFDYMPNEENYMEQRIREQLI